jgi:iron complex outermembrane receptor protein
MRTRKSAVVGLVGAFVSCACAGLVYAEDAATTNEGLEEIVVTAQWRAESAQSTPLALTVVSGEEIAKQGVSQPEDLGKLIPGLTVTNSAITTISIRGVGTVTEFDSLAQLGVAVSTDGVYIDRATEVAGNFYDLSRVEALLGPQGTLNGMNATGGAVNIITNKPTQDFGGYVQAEMGDYNLRRTTGALNLPVTDTLALRAAFYDSKRDGYTSDGYDDEDLRAARLHALWTPNSDVSLLVTVEASKLGGQGVGNVFVNLGLTGAQSSPEANSLRQFALVPGPNGPQEIPQPGAPYQDFNNHNARAQLDWNLGFAKLTYIPGYRGQTFSYVQPAVQGGLASAGKSSQFTNELRLANDSDKWKWTVGLFSLNEHVDFGFHAGFVFFTLLPANIPVLASAYQTLNTPNYDTRSDAAFGETTYSFTDKFRVFAGLRYTTETKTSDLINQWYGEGFNIPGRSTTAIDRIRPAIPPLMASRSVRRRLAEFPGARQQLADAALRS